MNLLTSNSHNQRFERMTTWMRKRRGIVLVMLLVAGCRMGKSTEELIGDLSSDEEIDRVKAVRLLPRHKGDAAEVVPALIRSLKDPHADIRWSAAIGLGYFGAAATTALPALKAAKDDKDARVREGVRVAIARIKGSE